jgi:hypothetical protein
MAKVNNKVKTYAEEGLEEVTNEAAAAEAAIGAATAYSSSDGEEFVQVGGSEPVKFFYRFQAPKKPTNSPYQILEKDTTLTGIYERSFAAGKYENLTYVIRLDNGDLVGIPGTGSLTKAMDKLATGSKVKITYKGMESIKGGQWAGSEAHSFIVLGNKLK